MSKRKHESIGVETPEDSKRAKSVHTSLDLMHSGDKDKEKQEKKEQLAILPFNFGEEEQNKPNEKNKTVEIVKIRYSKKECPAYSEWIKSIGLDTSLQMNVFKLHSDGGIICKLCMKHPYASIRGKNAEVYTSVSARPKRKYRLANHLSSDKHQYAIDQEKTTRSIALKVLEEDTSTKIDEADAQQIYSIIKQELAKSKITSMQTLVERIDHMYSAGQGSARQSNFTVMKFILFLSNHIKARIVLHVRNSPCWSTMVDEFTDIVQLQQYITFVKYIAPNGALSTAFLDMRPVSDIGPASLFRLWKEVAADYDLNINKHVAMACNGATALSTQGVSLSSKLKAASPKILTTNCYVHRIALSFIDNNRELEFLKKFERVLVQVWKYFSSSPLKAAQLGGLETSDVSSVLKLVEIYRTRWLNHTVGVTTLKNELSKICDTLKYFESTEDDCTAYGLLHSIGSKQFIFSLYLVHEVLAPLHKLSRFLTSSFNFSQLPSTLTLCVDEITRMQSGNQVIQNLSNDWGCLSKILPDSQQELLERDCEEITAQSKVYCEALIQSLHEHFPQALVLSAFKIFDKREIPQNVEERLQYGLLELQLLLIQFELVETKSEMIKKIFDNYQILKNTMLSSDFDSCLDAIAVCNKIAQDKKFKKMCPVLHQLCCILLVIPRVSAMPERGLSLLSRVQKNQQICNNPILSAILNISVNGPGQLSDEDAKLVADKWQCMKVHEILLRRQSKSQLTDPVTMDVDIVDEWESVFNKLQDTKQFLL